jgi:hypothetical protein
MGIGHLQPIAAGVDLLGQLVGRLGTDRDGAAGKRLVDHLDLVVPDAVAPEPLIRPFLAIEGIVEGSGIACLRGRA